jgi:signal transduction histidine kinase
VELQGIVTAVLPDGVMLRTRGGTIQIGLRVTGMEPADFRKFENALVRVRGCLYASWDYASHQVKVGEIRIYDAAIRVEQPAPEDLFSSPSKTPAELLLFDPQAGEFERVKVSGQIIYARAPEYFMMCAGRGLRLTMKEPSGLRVGDIAEVVGFPELLGNGSPVLREGVARKIGYAELPKPKKLRPDDLLLAAYDSTRVEINGVLTGVRKSGNEQILEMQNGVRTFVARLNRSENPAKTLDVGSRLKLTGVYSGQGGNKVAGQNLTSFELLLGSPTDLVVLARPPWWTLQRLLVIVGVLICILAATMLWVTQLHRKVEERTTELGRQIQERQRLENQRAMEQERARIAQDLHDELGSGITEISMLAARAKSATAPDEKRNAFLDSAGAKAREMVTALDEIVWAMNPRHDSVASLVSYFRLYADRFLGLANIAWQFEGPTDPPDRVLDSQARHQLFLAFKEALTNVVRHSRATEVRLSIVLENDQLRVSIVDNGVGFSPEKNIEPADGLANMRARLDKLRGRSEIESEPGRGTTVRLSVPLHSES